MEYEQTKFTKAEVVDVVSKYVGIESDTMVAVVAILEKLRVIPEYIFQELKLVKHEPA